MKDIAVFAQTTYRNEFKKFGIKTDDRRRHMYLIGKTGMGKSTILENMIVDDIRAGHGVAVVDPHGDLAEKIIEYIPSERIEDVVYFNPSDINFPIAFNVVEQVEGHLRHLVASGLIGVFQKLWADSWGPRLEYILRNAILAILDFPGSTLLGVVRMLSDKNYRKRVVANIKDPVVKAFWEKEFSGYADKFASEAVSPIQNKVGQFLSSSLMRNIIGQVKSAIDIRDIMDNGKILIMNLSKGRIGEDNSALLGAMMITKIQLAAMSRVDVPEKERRDFYLYIDEFQNFSTDSFANILSEARKYRLNLILAHQYIEQLSEKVKPAVFGNVGTMVVFRVGAADAEELVKEFTPTFTEEDIVNLPKYEMYLKLMIDGIASSPFSAAGLPPLRGEDKTGNTEKVINYSREKYATDRETVEEKIMRWHESYDEDSSGQSLKRAPLAASAPSAYNPPRPSSPIRSLAGQPASQVKSAVAPEAVFRPLSAITPAFSPSASVRSAAPIGARSNSVAPSNRMGSSAKPAFKLPKNGHEAVCASCGQTTIIAFEPDGIRPVYCRDCLSKKKEEKRQEVEARRLAKEAEKRRFEEAPAAPIATPTISLGDLNKINPVDFRGKELKVSHVVKKNDEPEDNGPANTISHHPAPANYVEKNPDEGEEVTILQNNF
ncbi:MAG: CxxC-x17-CxxC domain-containing protein [Patescibacteria group bacterium]|jgi:CxxC-x17-CxxC domain-containing protein